ncbi:hypothetical protein ACFPK9_04295 [Rubritalea spongiae]|uniref:DUF2946 domain-containing protein n=1 Tax=Rubritalea spongiae TaxID=430797 RepID=A0ABW5E5V2_9BACT
MFIKNQTLKRLIISQLRVLMIVLLILSLGVGSVVIQVLGWATMLPTQLAKTGSVSQAVENTFDGKHACSMCEIAAAKREAEQQPAPEAPAPKEQVKEKQPVIALAIAPLKLFSKPKSAFPSLTDDLAQRSFGHHPDTPPPQQLS